MKYIVRFSYEGFIHDVDVTANNKREAYKKGKQKLAKRLFKMSMLRNYECIEAY